MKTLSELANVIEDLDSDVVTLVRKQTVYSEIVISKDKFKEIQDAAREYEHDLYFELVEQMVTDEVMKDIGDEEEEWLAFSGDVQQCTDDMITWTDRKWDCFTQLSF
jgi:hypothetical protein